MDDVVAVLARRAPGDAVELRGSARARLSATVEVDAGRPARDRAGDGPRGRESTPRSGRRRGRRCAGSAASGPPITASASARLEPRGVGPLLAQSAACSSTTAEAATPGTERAGLRERAYASPSSGATAIAARAADVIAAVARDRGRASSAQLDAVADDGDAGDEARAMAGAR